MIKKKLNKAVRMPPQNIKAEKSLLGSLMIDPIRINFILDLVLVGDFYQNKHNNIYSVMVELNKKRQPIDMLTVSSKLKEKNLIQDIGGDSYLAELCGEVPTASNAKHYAEIIKDKKTLRDLIYSSEKIFQSGYDEKREVDEILLEAETEIFKVVNKNKEKEEVVDINKLLDNFEKESKIYSEKLENGQKYIGIETGFKKLDNIIDGLREGHLWVLGGYTSSGKTFFSLNIASSLIKQKKRVVYFSLEMSKTDIIGRLLGILTGINGTKILKGYSSQEDYQNIKTAKEKLRESGLVIYSKTTNINHIRTAIMREQLKKNVDVIMLDYLQLVGCDKQKEYETMREVAITFQNIANEMKVPIILLSQISQESARNPNSRVIGFRGAGAIADASDLAIELIPALDIDDHKEKLSKGEEVPIKCLIRKNRHGAVGTIINNFCGRTGIFKEQIYER